MNTTNMLIVAGVLIASILWLALRSRRTTEDWLPPELTNARLALIEKDLFCERPFRLAGRPDRVYEHQSGIMTPLGEPAEFGKNRTLRFSGHP